MNAQEQRCGTECNIAIYEIFRSQVSAIEAFTQQGSPETTVIVPIAFTVYRNDDGMYTYADIPARRLDDLDNLCINYRDDVSFEDTNEPVKNVRIRLNHPNHSEFSISTTGAAGTIQGNQYYPTISTERQKLGSNGADFSYNRADWINGVTTFDLVRLIQHTLGTITLNGYQQIAAAVNNSGTLTIADAVVIQQLILTMNDDFPLHNSPWRFVPEYIPHSSANSFHNNPFDMVISGIGTGTGSVQNAPYLNNDWEYTLVDFNGENGLNGFDAVKLGDTNGSADPQQYTHINNQEPLPQEPSNPIFIQISEIEAIAGGFDVKFDIQSTLEKVAFQAGIEFDVSKLQYKDIITQQDDLEEFSKEEDFGLNKVQAGKIQFLWVSPDGTSRNISENSLDMHIQFFTNLTVQDFIDELYTLDLTRGNDNPSISGLLSLQDDFPNYAYDEDGNEHPVKLTISSGLKSRISNYQKGILVYPNPVQNSMSFDFRLLEQEKGKLTIFDNLGRVVTRHNIDDTNSIFYLGETTNWNVGTYYYQFETSQSILSGKFVKL